MPSYLLIMQYAAKYSYHNLLLKHYLQEPQVHRLFIFLHEDIKNFNLLDNDIASIGELVETQQEISLTTW